MRDARAAATEFWRRTRDPHPFERRRAWRAILRLCPPAGARPFLDVAGGSGSLAERALRKGFWAVTLDVAPFRTGERVTGVMEQLPFATGSCDVVVLCAALSHSDDPGRAVAEAVRALSPGGRLFVALSPVHEDDGEAREATRRQRARLARSGTPALASTYRHLSRPEVEGWVLAAGGEVAWHPETLGPALRAWRSAKRLALGGPWAGFPLLVVRRNPSQGAEGGIRVPA
ncbi:MAG: class I SAM-dependent methyltransferase [Thermoplasmatota archaeon]